MERSDSEILPKPDTPSKVHAINGIAPSEIVSSLSGILDQRNLTADVLTSRMQELGFGLNERWFRKSISEKRTSIQALIEKFSGVAYN